MHTFDSISNYSEMKRDHEIVEEMRNYRLCLFIGAGASIDYGMPSWDNFAYKYLEMIVKELEEVKIINFKTKEQIKKMPTIDILSMCEHLVKKHRLTVARNEFLKDTFKTKKKFPFVVPGSEKSYDYINEISAVFITTNYDNILDTYINNPRQTVDDVTDGSTIEEYNRDKRVFSLNDIINDDYFESTLRPGSLVHIHGSIELDDESFSKFVISREDYIERYHDDNDVSSSYRNFLQEIFEKYTVVFVGYGLKEIEILKYMFKASGRGSKKRYLFHGCSGADCDFMNLYEDYLMKQYNIEILPYDLTVSGYQALIPLLEELAGISKEVISEEGNKDLDMILNEDW